MYCSSYSKKREKSHQIIAELSGFNILNVTIDWFDIGFDTNKCNALFHESSFSSWRLECDSLKSDSVMRIGDSTFPGNSFAN